MVSADFDPRTDFSRYRTYGWEAADALPTGDARLDANPFFDARVRAAVERELAMRGFMRVTSGTPDLAVHYHAAVDQRIDVFAVDREAGYTTEYGEGTQVREYEQGTIVLDLAEGRSKRVVWRGWAQADIEGLIDDPRRMEAWIDEAARRMMERFPGVASVSP